MNNNALILANGEAPTKKLMKKLLEGSSLFVCADGGANAAARYGLKPSAIVGDLDSTTRQTLKALRKAEIHKFVDDYSTDLEKTLSWVIDKGIRSITVTGVAGGRLDHFIGNLSALVKFSAKATITFVDDSGEWIFIGRSKNLSLPVGATVSLIPLSHCDGIVTKGLRWNLNFEALELGVRDGTSNLVVESPIHISVAKGNLILFHLLKSAAARTLGHPEKRTKR
jgi:thiamine pyrophosphokinase